MEPPWLGILSSIVTPSGVSKCCLYNPTGRGNVAAHSHPFLDTDLCLFPCSEFNLYPRPAKTVTRSVMAFLSSGNPTSESLNPRMALGPPKLQCAFTRRLYSCIAFTFFKQSYTHTHAHRPIESEFQQKN